MPRFTRVVMFVAAALAAVAQPAGRGPNPSELQPPAQTPSESVPPGFGDRRFPRIPVAAQPYLDAVNTTWDEIRAELRRVQKTDPATYVRSGQLRFLLPDIDGMYVSPGDAAYRGKWLIVSLIGTWTAYSRDMASTLNGLRRTFPENYANVVAIAFERGEVDQHLPNLRQFCAENAVEFPVLYGGSTDDIYKSLPDLSAVEAVPLTFVIDPQGQVVLAEEGITPETSDKLRAATSRMSSADRDNLPSHGIGARLMLHKPPPDGLAVVVNVIPNTPAAEAGIQVGDVIVEVDGKATAGLELVDVVKLIRRDRVDAVTLTIAREGEPYVLTFPLIVKEVTKN